MPSLGSHGNVENTCLLILSQRGYRLSVEEISENSTSASNLAWIAEKNGETFVGYNPIELLGLTAIYEYINPIGETQPYWWVVKGPNIRDELLQAAFPDDEQPE